MRSIARLSAALLLSVAAVSGCSGDDGEDPVVPGGGLPDASPGAQPDTGTASWPDSGQSPAGDAGRDTSTNGGDGATPGLDLEIPKSSVDCGGTPCETLDNVCCESWSDNTGFTSDLSCITRDACRKKYPYQVFEPFKRRAVMHECDDMEDCSGGQVCCFYAFFGPLCDAADAFMCPSKMTGPGGSRICTDANLCQLCTDAMSCSFIGEGAVPIAVLSCTNDSDCVDRPGTSCQPEQDNSATTGRGVKARSYVKVCR